MHSTVVVNYYTYQLSVEHYQDNSDDVTLQDLTVVLSYPTFTVGIKEDSLT